MDYYEVVKARRSIRKFTDDPVPKEAIDRILEAARIAPSWKNQQCWRFVLVDDADIKEALADIVDGNPCSPAVRQAPYTIVVCAVPGESGNTDDKPYYLVDSGIVMEHILLALAAEGLGGCFVGWFDEQKVREALGIPADVKVIGFTPVGVPDQQPKDRGRKPLDELLHHNRW